MVVTIGDIAKDAGVSVSTVSRVMNRSKTVSDELKERVMSSVDKLNYRPNAAARSLITKKTDIIAVVEADITNPVTLTILRDIDEYCAKIGKVVMMCDYHYNNEKAISLLDKLLERNLDGIVFMGVSFEERLVEKLRQFECPVILAQQGIEGSQEFITLTDDSYHAAQDVTSFLIQDNHKRIAFISGDENDYTNGRLRLQGFVDQMKKNGLEIPDSYITHSEFSMKGGKSGMKKIYENSVTLPTAVICGNDLIAAGAIRYLKSVKVRVPEDISVFGFDDSLEDVFELPLSTVVSRERGKLICEQLFGPKKEKKEWIYYPYQLLRRYSTTKLI